MKRLIIKVEETSRERGNERVSEKVRGRERERGRECVCVVCLCVYVNKNPRFKSWYHEWGHLRPNLWKGTPRWEAEDPMLIRVIQRNRINKVCVYVCVS